MLKIPNAAILSTPQTVWSRPVFLWWFAHNPNVRLSYSIPKRLSQKRAFCTYLVELSRLECFVLNVKYSYLQKNTDRPTDGRSDGQLTDAGIWKCIQACTRNHKGNATSKPYTSSASRVIVNVIKNLNNVHIKRHPKIADYCRANLYTDNKYGWLWTTTMMMMHIIIVVSSLKCIIFSGSQSRATPAGSYKMFDIKISWKEFDKYSTGDDCASVWMEWICFVCYGLACIVCMISMRWTNFWGIQIMLFD